MDISEDILGNNLKIDYPVLSDIGSFLNRAVALKDGNIGIEHKHKEWIDHVKSAVVKKWDRIAEEYKRTSDSVIAAKIFEALDKLTDAETVFVGDAGTPTPYLSAYIRQKKAGKQNVIPRSHGALGFALPASIGAQLGRPEARVISLFGDASFGMALGELETVKRLELPIIFINFQNDCYGWIKTIQHLYYDSHFFGVDFSSVDAVKIAKGFGIKGRNIMNNQEIDEVLKWALEQKSPVFINVVVEQPTEYIPPVSQWEIDARLKPEDRKKLVY